LAGLYYVQVSTGTHQLTKSSFMTLYFQDGGHDVRPPLHPQAAARRVRSTSLAHCIRYSFWSMAHSYTCFHSACPQKRLNLRCISLYIIIL